MARCEWEILVGEVMGVRKLPRKWLWKWLPLSILLTGTVSGCGNQYVLFHPAGPVAATELHMLLMASLAMLVVIVPVFILFLVTIVRFRDRPGNKAPYWPNWHGNKRMEILWWIIPFVILAVIAVPTVSKTYALTRLPKSKHPLVIDVTSLTWKWMFQYPGQHIATVNYLEIPAGRPVLFELTADSAMNTFWVPRLGGMEYTMPNTVLPLWLEASKPGVYWGHSGQYSGLEFEKMFFNVKAVTPSQFDAWVAHAKTLHPMTLKNYRSLLKFNTVGVSTYGGYPAHTFPTIAKRFTLRGGMYTTKGAQGHITYLPMPGMRVPGVLTP